jgi:hypothetical protein
MDPVLTTGRSGQLRREGDSQCLAAPPEAAKMPGPERRPSAPHPDGFDQGPHWRC